MNLMTLSFGDSTATPSDSTGVPVKPDTTPPLMMKVLSANEPIKLNFVEPIPFEPRSGSSSPASIEPDVASVTDFILTDFSLAISFDSKPETSSSSLSLLPPLSSELVEPEEPEPEEPE